jgi:hypothetical protein
MGMTSSPLIHHLYDEIFTQVVAQHPTLAHTVSERRMVIGTLRYDGDGDHKLMRPHLSIDFSTALQAIYLYGYIDRHDSPRMPQSYVPVPCQYYTLCDPQIIDQLVADALLILARGAEVAKAIIDQEMNGEAAH